VIGFRDGRVISDEAVSGRLSAEKVLASLPGREEEEGENARPTG
jgi:hypothetical protein